MPRLPEYQTISEKEKYFNNGAIEVNVNIDKIFDEIQKLVDTGDFVFRGCSEAKYKLFNSAQRFYLGNELYRHTHETQAYDHYDQFVGDLETVK